MGEVKYLCLDTGIRADEIGSNLDKSLGWNDAEFPTLEEAREYLMNWLGIYAPRSSSVLKVGKKHYYHGREHWVTIVKLEG